MPYVIYRKSDNLICAFVHPRSSEESEKKQLAAEIQNVLNSELKGKTEDYGHALLDRMPTSEEIIEISGSGRTSKKISYKPHPVIEARKKVRESVIGKLAKLGLTVEEAAAILGS
jgi:hypothetical protein